MSIETKVDNYRFFDFDLRGNDVIFSVAPLDFLDFITEDTQKVKGILADMGKWEDLVMTGLNLFSDLKIVNIEPNLLQTYDKPHGAKLYTFGVATAHPQLLIVTCHLIPEERRKRVTIERIAHPTGLLPPILMVDEIRDQICNIVKWKTFKKTIVLIRA